MKDLLDRALFKKIVDVELNTALAMHQKGSVLVHFELSIACLSYETKSILASTEKAATSPTAAQRGELFAQHAALALTVRSENAGLWPNVSKRNLHL